MNKKNKSLISVGIVLILLLAAVAAVIQLQISELASAIEDDDNVPLTVTISVDKNSGIAPFRQNFTAIVINNKGSVDYEWDFGDGTTSKEIAPSHIYETNGTYVCSLNIKDETQEKTDTIEIVVTDNQAPTVAIIMEDTKFSRRWLPGTILLWSKMADNYWGRDIKDIIKRLDNSSKLFDKEGPIDCDALVYDPEGDDIVSYRWELKPKTYTSRIILGGDQHKPKYIFEGKSVTFPEIMVYGAEDYDLTLFVEDSSGNIGTDTIQFTVEMSQQESKFKGYKQSYNRVNDNWLKKWSKNAIGIALIGGLSSLIPNSTAFPLIRLAAVLFLYFGWDIELEGITIIKTFKEMLQKYPALANLMIGIFEKAITTLENIQENKPELEEQIDEFIIKIEELMETLGLRNNKPIIFNPRPENNVESISNIYPHVSIDVEDSEGEKFNISINGEYINDISLTNQHNGTFTAELLSPLPLQTEIIWNVNVTDPYGRQIDRQYKFTTW